MKKVGLVKVKWVLNLSLYEMVKYSLSTREMLRAELEGFSEDSGSVSLFIPTQVMKQIFLIGWISILDTY